MRKCLAVAALSVLAAALALGSSGCSSMMRNASMAVHYTDTGVNDIDQYPILRASGYAVLSKQKGAMEAYRELTEQLVGVYVKAKNRNGNTVERSDTLTTEVEGMVHGARVVRQYPIGDTYVTELELDTKRLYDLYQIRGVF